MPPTLKHQWLVEMLRRFNLHFALFDAERLAGDVAALLGREDAALYAGSWSDWCSYL